MLNNLTKQFKQTNGNGFKKPVKKRGRSHMWYIRHSDEYKEWRIAVFNRDKYTCQVCGKKCGRLNAHHIIPFHSNPALRLEIENGITLCHRCHNKFHKKYGKKNFPSIVVEYKLRGDFIDGR